MLYIAHFVIFQKELYLGNWPTDLQSVSGMHHIHWHTCTTSTAQHQKLL